MEIVRRVLGFALVAAAVVNALRRRGTAARASRASRRGRVLDFAGVAAGAWLLSRPAEGRLREVTVSARIGAPPEAVFAAVSDPRKPFLTDNPFTTMTVVGDQTRGAGTVYRWTFTLPLGLRLRFDEVVTEWAEGERFAYRATSGWEMEAVTALAPLDGGTLVTFTLRYRLPGLWHHLMPRWLVAASIWRAIANIGHRVGEEPAGTGTPAGAVPVVEFVVNIAAPPREVFRVVGDPRSKVVWVPGIRRVVMQSGGPLGPGSRYVASSGLGPVEFAFSEEIVQWDPPARLAYRGRSGRGRFLTTWRMEAANGGSRVRCRMDYWFPGGRLGAWLGRIVASLVQAPMSGASARRIKAAVEQGRWPPAGS